MSKEVEEATVITKEFHFGPLPRMIAEPSAVIFSKLVLGMKNHKPLAYIKLKSFI
jgi:hypothetical protein